MLFYVLASALGAGTTRDLGTRHDAGQERPRSFYALSAAEQSDLEPRIYVSNADGSGARNVSQSPTAVEDDQAHWSPDGAWIVFDRCTSGGPCSIWLVRPDGSGQRRLTPNCRSSRAATVCADDSGRSFAPGGRRVVFTHESGRLRHSALGDQIEHSAIATLDLNGKHLAIVRRLAPYAGVLQAPRISPNGKLIVFDRFNSASVHPAGGDALFVARVKGGISRQLTPWRLSAGSPDWSPDGKQILFKRFIPGGGVLDPWHEPLHDRRGRHSSAPASPMWAVTTTSSLDRSRPTERLSSSPPTPTQRRTHAAAHSRTSSPCDSEQK